MRKTTSPRLIAFDSANLLPGFEPSADSVLQSSLLYPNTPRHRIGVKYQQLPVNQNLVPELYNFQRDENMAFHNQVSRHNYLSSIESLKLAKRDYHLEQLAQFKCKEIKYLSGIVDDNSEQTKVLGNKARDGAQRKRVKQRVTGHMGTCMDKGVFLRAISIWAQVDADLANIRSQKNGVDLCERILGR